MTSGKVATTVGYERRNNPSLMIADVAAFVAHMTAHQPPRPANMLHIVAINQGRRPYSAEEHRVPACDPHEARERMARGHLVLDGRSPAAFGAAHVPGAHCVPIDTAGFEQNVGWILPEERPIVLVVDDPADAPVASRKLAFVGLDRRLAAFVEMRAWVETGLPCAELREIDVQALRREIAAGAVRVLDVRAKDEWRAGHVPEAIHADFRHLARTLDSLGLRSDEPLAVICGGGVRSSTAASILLGCGFETVYNVAGGMQAWSAAGLPRET